MLKKSLILATAILVVMSSLAEANDRYQNRPPIIISPDLTAPWVTQLGGTVEPVVYRQQRPIAVQQPSATRKQYLLQRRVQRSGTTTAQPVQPVSMMRAQKPKQRQIDPQFLPQTVAYETQEKPGTIVIDTNSRFLYLVTGNGEARRYGVGVGKPGFEWAGAHKVTRKAEWPTWTPPSEMRAREAAKGHFLPVSMEGGPENPLGARAMYLGSTLYRIHGTNAPWTIGYAVSSGCIRMRNEDVTDLYERVNVGTKVIVI
ncbi:ErfK/YbiS/YcfS/YnhG family protein [Pararhizobium polonicum]|uniref:ErfK/YbiS/YcfS/YnhG family protein n=1 Tax=Pararhizobium polonicum TaxID=1612624 RepID=A0A1C7NUK6_9HYPH|nr:L,D-transpeptidase [Pararhizobium polonicum]OBZ92670.1 ErfK/YbiS/YcfS/YnhG family protein [Pararhizobium polonicum]